MLPQYVTLQIVTNSYRFPWTNIRFITQISLVSSIQSLARITNIHVTMPCCVTPHMYVFVKLSRNQSWVNLLFSVPRDSILDSILDSLFSILNSRFAQESRIANRVENWDSQRTVNLLLNSTVWDVKKIRTAFLCKFICRV